MRVSARPLAAQLLEDPDAVLMRKDLRALGWERRAVDAIFRELDVIFLPGYSYGAVRVRDYLTLIERCTYGRDRVRPTRAKAQGVAAKSHGYWPDLPFAARSRRAPEVDR